MYSVVLGDGFVASVKKLDNQVKVRINDALPTLQKDPFHLKLHTKPLRGNLKGAYSFRVSRDYRVIFKFLDNKIIFLLRAKHRKDIYK